MQTNENVDQIRQLARLPEIDGVPNSKRPALEGRTKRPDAGASHPVAAKLLQGSVGSNSNPRRYGAGF